MQLLLNIYNKKAVVKTYETDTYDLMFGTIEDLIKLIEIDKVEGFSDTDLIKLATNLVTNGMDLIKDLLKDIFDGITDEEIKKTKVSEIIAVLMTVINYSINQISKNLPKNGKN